jgi:hypothetical protein
VRRSCHHFKRTCPVQDPDYVPAAPAWLALGCGPYGRRRDELSTTTLVATAFHTRTDAIRCGAPDAQQDIRVALAPSLWRGDSSPAIRRDRYAGPRKDVTRYAPTMTRRRDASAGGPADAGLSRAPRIDALRAFHASWAAGAGFGMAASDPQRPLAPHGTSAAVRRRADVHEQHKQHFAHCGSRGHAGTPSPNRTGPCTGSRTFPRDAGAPHGLGRLKG